MGNQDSKAALPQAVVTPSVQQTPKEDGPKIGRSGKKICCSCPDTKKLRDECVVMNGEENCLDLINAHKECLRAEGFTIK
mmetsp:Transcript_28082/g.48543  ORF Transcript_28082/g.48543 Transcript_28082/m.48543 type:complete len:80 (+) Transcript_28082:28-267(+)